MTNETVNPAGSPKINQHEQSDKDDRSLPFARFRELTRRLVQVPKSEIDQERQDTK
jgi:hypothetical protein